MKYVKYANKHFYHIYNRGVEGRGIFNDDKDYLRFVHCLYEFNDQNPALPYGWVFKQERLLNKERPRELLVSVLCFCLMPNHFHLILEQIAEGGITKFMRKLGTGYTMYFNEKYERNGVLFQGKFKAILIETDEYLTHLSRYIHLNPLELLEPDWKQKGIEDRSRTESFLCEYRWSSFLDYIGIRNFSSVTKRELIQSYFTPGSYKDFVFNFLAKDVQRIKSFLLE
jgi:putative transposase